MVSSRTLIGLLIAAAAVGLLANGCGPSGGGTAITVEGPVELSRSFTEGEVLKYRLEVNTQSGVKRTAYEQTIYSQTELKTSNTFEKVTDESVEMKMHFDYAVGSMTVSDEVVPDQSVASLRGKALLFTLTPEGEVNAWAGLSDEDYLQAGAGQMAMLLYDFFPPLPNEPVGVGSTWTTDYNVPDITTAVDRDFIGETTYTVLGFKERNEIPCVEIERVSSFEFEGRAEQAGEIWLMSGSGAVSGKMLLSIDAGRVIYGSSETTLTLQGEGASVASAAASNVVNMGIKSNLVIDLMK